MELTTLSVIVGAAGTCALGGIFPWIAAEAVILATALAVPASAFPLLAVSCAVGQMTGKAGLYGIIRWAPARLPERFQRLIGRAEVLGRRPGALTGSVLSGAAVGLPPLYVVTLAAGLAHLSLVRFLVAGLLGSAIRYGVLLWGAGAVGLGGFS